MRRESQRWLRGRHCVSGGIYGSRIDLEHLLAVVRPSRLAIICSYALQENNPVGFGDKKLQLQKLPRMAWQAVNASLIYLRYDTSRSDPSIYDIFVQDRDTEDVLIHDDDDQKTRAQTTDGKPSFLLSV
jgi:hypothetical protein